jgi:uncharacterized membrane protein YdbT with pleckstrin-like domain
MALIPSGTELRPDRKLLAYYAIGSLFAGPFFFIPLIPLFFRYETLRYRFDAEGVAMRWGILFRREISLTYARIQDIHLSSNVLERWLGLGKVQIQTASGSASAEMVIEGLPNFEEVRDFLYSKMRGAHGDERPSFSSSPERPDEPSLAALLRETAAELREVRLALERRNG